MHNGYFKSLADIVHFYNTRFDGTSQDTVTNPPDQPRKTVCADDEATAKEAIAANCWPAPEFPGTTVVAGRSFGQLGLDQATGSNPRRLPSDPQRRKHAYGA